jgi:hypothetical protein
MLEIECEYLLQGRMHKLSLDKTHYFAEGKNEIQNRTFLFTDDEFIGFNEESTSGDTHYTLEIIYVDP